MKKLLTIKHWQLFLLLIGVPFIFQIFFVSTLFMSDDPLEMIRFFPNMMVIVVGVFFGWFYAMGTSLHKRLPETVTMNLTLFKIFLCIPVIYLFTISILLFEMFSSALSGDTVNPFVFLIIFPLHLFSMFCIFYCLYFNAKALKSVEMQRPLTFSDFAGEFFLIWFFPIGIWIIQPRINKIFGETYDHNDNKMLDDTL